MKEKKSGREEEKRERREREKRKKKEERTRLRVRNFPLVARNNVSIRLLACR